MDDRRLYQTIMGWDEAEVILRRAVEPGLPRRGTELVHVVGIDETSFQERHEYVALAFDLERDRVLWVGDGRWQATPEACSRLSAAQHAAIEAVVIDMWDPYVPATRAALAGGTSRIVIDR